ncbi:hypothetical protein N7490_011907 [Penicillium lividum]|nr:hypothetical protein N7490_011907 [Penicillium lividum]
MYGIPTGAGSWAPSLSYINGTFYIASMTRWTYDPVARVWPRIYFASSTDLVEWSELTWAEPWGIDPSLFYDPQSKKKYLNFMAPNNNDDRIWGIYQCEISLVTGKCTGEYHSLWNGTLKQDSNARPEGPKMIYRLGFYYLLIAEGGTDNLHRATIARSTSPTGPWDPDPNNPLLFNGAYGYDNLTVQSTGYATLVETPEGRWYAAFLARRKVNGTSPLGRETFLTSVKWSSDGWPRMNNRQPILLSELFGPSNIEQPLVPASFHDNFTSSVLHPSWYQLRTPYTSNFALGRGLKLKPNVYGLSDRDTPAALLRKQKSLNMTFSATLSATQGSLGPRMTVRISAYLSEYQHQDIGIRGCINETGVCLYSALQKNTTVETQQFPLNQTFVPRGLTFHIRESPLDYQLGYSLHPHSIPKYVATIESSWQAFAPANYFVFEGNSFALFASGGGEPWPCTGPDVGFTEVVETYFDENIPDHDIW